MSKILCIDDDTDICLLLERYLSKQGYEVDKAFNGYTGLKQIEKNDYEVVLCDFRLPDKEGLEMIQEIKSLRPATQIIIITGYSDVKIAVKAIKYGAYEYVTKPIHPEEILLTIEGAIKKGAQSPAETSDSDKPSRKAAPSKREALVTSDNYVKGHSAQSKQLFQLVQLVAPTDMTVVVLGESGTGKEVAARTIHDNSKRKDKPFVAVDCGALPKELAGSELFGHKRGSFTGALADKQGHFEVASGGTLFLDEIGNLSYENQIKMLRVLQERKVRKIGDTKDTGVDVRVIVATNEDLKQSVKQGEFREDLYFRINEFRIEIPSLRERKSDIMTFANHFLNVSNIELDKNIEGYSDEVQQKFQDYFWPGNLREMKNVVKRATLLCTGDQISSKELPEEIRHPEFLDEESLTNDDHSEITDLKSVVERAEKKAILTVLSKTGYNKSKAAEILKVDRKTLYNKINAYDINTRG